MNKFLGAASIAALLAVTATPATAKTEPAPIIAKCAGSYGTVAITDGDTQGWTQFGLSSPRAMIAQLVNESGCFTLHNPASGTGADFLMSANAGSQEEIDQSMNAAAGAVKTAAIEGALRTGMLGRVPFAGSALGMLGGLGGKKKTVSAALRVVSPQNGATLIAASGQAQKSMMKLMGQAEWMQASMPGAEAYRSSKDGQMLTTAFVQAYNGLVAQASALGPIKTAAATPAAATQ